MGYKVFPCIPRGKSPITRFCPHGCVDATNNTEIISRWWKEEPDANIGIKCENLLVLDVDVKKGDGKEDMKFLCEKFGNLPPSPYTQTGSGGYHLFFKRPNEDILGSKKIFIAGRKTEIDIQTGNQYVIAPPSINENGHPYIFGEQIGRIETLPELPQKWVNALPHRNSDFILPQNKLIIPSIPQTKQQDKNSVIDRCRNYIARLEPAIQGNFGHRQILRACNAIFFGFGLDKIQGWPILEEFNARCVPPWDFSNPVELKEINRKADQAIAYKSEKYKRGYLANKENPHSEDIDLDISTLLENHFKNTNNISEPKQEYIPVKAPPTIKSDLLYCPGFVGELIDFCKESAPVYTSGAAFCGAIAMQSFLCGRKVRSITDLRTNLYLVALAGSSSGKDHPRKINTHLMHAINQMGCLGDKFVSGEAIQDILASKFSVLFQSDEFDTVFKNIALGKEVYTNNLMSTLLTIYTSSNTFYPVRKRAGNVELPAINQPHLTIFGTSPPDCYYQSFSGQMLQGGLFARLMIFDSNDRIRNKRPKPITEMPARLLETAKWWSQFNPVMQDGNMSTFSPVPHTIEQTDGATRILDEWLDYTDSQWQEAKKSGCESYCSVWGRANENAIKLALIYAASENAQDPKISEAAAKWSVSLVEALVNRQLYLAETYSAKNIFDGYCKEALRILAKWHDEKGCLELLPKWLFKRKFRIDPRTFDETLKELEDQKKIVFEIKQSDGAGKPSSGYRMIG